MLSYFIVAQCAFATNFSSKISLNFKSFLVRIPFHRTLVHFRPAFRRTLQTVSTLIDGGMLALIITLFHKNFPSLLASVWFVVRYFSFVKQLVLAFFPDYSFVATKYPIFFFICPQVFALEYF